MGNHHGDEHLGKLIRWASDQKASGHTRSQVRESLLSRYDAETAALVLVRVFDSNEAPDDRVSQKIMDVAQKTGAFVARLYGSIATGVAAAAKAPTHEHRIVKLEEEVSRLSVDVASTMRWLQDLDNRMRLLEHFEGYDFDDIRCQACGSSMRVKKNRTDGSLFLGCVKYKANPATGKKACPARTASREDLRVMLNRLRAVS